MLGKIGHPTGERVIDLVHILNVGANTLSNKNPLNKCIFYHDIVSLHFIV